MRRASLLVVATTLMAATVGCDRGAEPVAARPAVAAESVPVTEVALRPAAAAYVAAVNDGDLDALVAAFAPTGRVRDVSRMIEGLDRVRSWARNEVIGGRLRVIRTDQDRSDGQRLLVRWAPAGSDGWDAYYDFTYDADDRILLADLQYA